MTTDNLASQNTILTREDRIGRYFKKYLNRYGFVEFSEDFIKKSPAGDLMRGVPIPVKTTEVGSFAGGDGISMLTIADNMANVMGCDPYFKHTKDYVAILKKLFDETLCANLVKAGNDFANKEEYDDACIYFRAVLCMNPDYLDAMYSYAKACRSMYEKNENEEFVGRFKAESLDWFEILTLEHPQFDMGHYYLGFAYMNLGLYAKAKLAWEEYLKLNRRKSKGKEYEEISDRVKQLEDPVTIEQGCILIDAGKAEEGLKKLLPYEKTSFNRWWPLHYYMGRAFQQLQYYDDAEKEFKKVLILNGSHIETMKELVTIYQRAGSWANVKKFTEKIKMIEKAQQEDQAKFIEETQKESKRMEEEIRDEK